MAMAERPAERGECGAPTKCTLPLARVPPRTHKVWNGSEACPNHQSLARMRLLARQESLFICGLIL